MKKLSKSKILSSRQCHKKLWLEIHHSELALDSSQSQKNFAVGQAVGAVAQKIYDPNCEGSLIDPFAVGFSAAVEKTKQLMQADKPIFEATFANDGGLIMADVLLPSGDAQSWHMVEVKASTAVKEIHRDDVAIQHYVASSAGCSLASIAVGHIDNQWVYQGDANYQGLITEVDLTEHASRRAAEVESWFAQAQAIVESPSEPDIEIGPHCSTPYDCAFFSYCSKDQAQASTPVDWLPRIQSNVLKAHIEDNGVIDMADVPDSLLNHLQRRVKHATLSNTVYFDQPAARALLAQFHYPHYYLDFETINLAVPRWAGTRAYQQVPFQFSLHALAEPDGSLEHYEFLDLSGDNPSRGLAEHLVSVCGKDGPVFVYNRSFESRVIKDLAADYLELSEPLMSIEARLVDLLPIVREHFYHPSQKGSWSIKAVLPAMAPELDYENLDGVQDGGMAMDAFEKAIHPDTSVAQRNIIGEQLRAYCERDTLAMVKMFNYLTI